MTGCQLEGFGGWVKARMAADLEIRADQAANHQPLRRFDRRVFRCRSVCVPGTWHFDLSRRP